MPRPLQVPVLLHCDVYAQLREIADRAHLPIAAIAREALVLSQGLELGPERELGGRALVWLPRELVADPALARRQVEAGANLLRWAADAGSLPAGVPAAGRRGRPLHGIEVVGARVLYPADLPTRRPDWRELVDQAAHAAGGVCAWENTREAGSRVGVLLVRD